MSFHPRMYASVHGFVTRADPHSIVLDHGAIDYWDVHCDAGAAGHYVSIHPRFVFILDHAPISFYTQKGGSAFESMACYIPAGQQLWSKVEKRRTLRHLDVHISNKHLHKLRGPGVRFDQPVHLSNSAGLGAMAEILAGECVTPQRSKRHIEELTNSIIHELFHLAASQTSDQSRHSLTPIVKAYLRENLDQKITVEHLAERAGMSRTNFNRMFRKETGSSPYQWILQAKVKHAQKYIQRGMPFAQIASATGFTDQAHFSRSFKLATGVAPGVWKIENQMGNSGPIIQDI
ncbi:AraC family transcriptional regulator [Actibacterium lipolyticum]|uniref:HTH-type transcriptional activator Btr n=1 Tax=Actibacterium lipolyticum TaxID=1524263 RepID=A0A238L814_9RHOB|nr:AraC family transcriptional regulator [Actibacterium lipolyticum]SMX51224.1 HTH-type transcriptional activator Btr [Actibacterium lipolyticum]